MTTTDATERLPSGDESRRVAFLQNVEPMEAAARTVCAFLNTEGGVLYAGVDGAGTPNGTANEGQADSLRKYLSAHITPRVLYDVALVRARGGNVVTVSVPAGPDRPYVFDGAVYVRRGGSTHHATATELRTLVAGSSESPARWERRPSVGLEVDDIDRPLLDDTVRKARDRRGVEFDDSRDVLATLRQLSVLQSGQFTNAADVLFGKHVARRHPQTRLRAVAYATDRADDFTDEQLFEGPAFRMLEDTMAFLRRNVPIASEFHSGKLPRDTKPKYPFNALREGLVNALVHRDYASFSGSVSVSIYPDRVEIWNTGRLPRGISPRDLLLPSHPSILVNPDIGHIFYLHELMERVGRGTYKIAQECREHGLRLPEWKNAEAGVRLTLFAAAGGDTLNDRQRKLLDALKPGELIRVSEYVERFGKGVTDRQARRDLTDLEGYGLLVRHRAGPKTAYKRTDRPL
jgi:ATP-dependent DNA helicase RecG